MASLRGEAQSLVLPIRTKEAIFGPRHAVELLALSIAQPYATAAKSLLVWCQLKTMSERQTMTRHEIPTERARQAVFRTPRHASASTVSGRARGHYSLRQLFYEAGKELGQEQYLRSLVGVIERAQGEEEKLVAAESLKPCPHVASVQASLRRARWALAFPTACSAKRARS